VACGLLAGNDSDKELRAEHKSGLGRRLETTKLWHGLSADPCSSSVHMRTIIGSAVLRLELGGSLCLWYRLR